VPDWYLFAGLAAGAAFLASRGVFRRRHQDAAANAAGLVAVADLTHVSPALQRTGLWAMAEGGFERRVVHGALSRGPHDVDVTAFDLETLRERRGEWAFLPVEPPFRIGGVVSVVVCEIDRRFPHVLWKRGGRGDKLIDDDMVDRASSITKLARDGLGLPRSYAAELPPALATKALDVELPAEWRAYGDPTCASALLANGFAGTLERAARRDLVIELLDTMVVVYPAARDVVGADAFADLTTTALVIVDGVLAASAALSPRGVEPQPSAPG
jgi:hypothetical protein